MSATRDRTQKFAFVYTNFYELYKKSQNKSSLQSTEQGAEQKAFEELSLPRAQIIKVGDLKKGGSIEGYVPPNFSAQKQSQAQKPTEALDSLKNNLKNLQELHAKLKYVLGELKTLSEDSKGKKST